MREMFLQLLFEGLVTLHPGCHHPGLLGARWCSRKDSSAKEVQQKGSGEQGSVSFSHLLLDLGFMLLKFFSFAM